jgi:class 3 adenylate cyclase
LTLLFCDLVDSTGIASRLDAEEWRDLVAGSGDRAGTEIQGDDLRRTFAHALAQIVSCDAAIVPATQHDMAVRMTGFVAVDRDPIEFGALYGPIASNILPIVASAAA